MRKSFLILFLLLPSLLLAQGAGSTGMAFLKFGVGARNLALGETGTVFGSDVSAVFYNPAHLAGKQNSEILLMHNEWIQDVRSEVLGVQFTLFGHPFALGINSTSVGEIEVRQRPGEPEAVISANYFAGSFGTAFTFGDDLKAGVTFKYLYEGIYGDEATGTAFDFGAVYSVNDVFSVAASARNIGSMGELRTEATTLPAEFRFGPLYENVLSDDLTLLLGAEFLKYFDVDGSHINAGAELTFRDIVAVRAGYRTNYEAKSYTGGIGIHYGRLTLDYAVTPFTYDLGTGHTFSVNISL